MNKETKEDFKRIFESELEDFTDNEIDEILDHAFMLTQYEKGGSFNFRKYLREVFKENYELDDNDYINYLSDSDDSDDIIYNMDEFDEILYDTKPSEIANLIYFGHYSPNDKYFKFDGYGNIESFNYIADEIDEDDVIDYLIDKSYDNYDEVEFVYNNEDVITKIAEYMVKNLDY